MKPIVFTHFSLTPQRNMLPISNQQIQTRYFSHGSYRFPAFAMLHSPIGRPQNKWKGIDGLTLENDFNHR